MMILVSPVHWPSLTHLLLGQMQLGLSHSIQSFVPYLVYLDILIYPACFSALIFTFAKEVMFLPVFVCLSVCLCVCVQDNSKSYGRIFLKFWRYVGHGIIYKWLNFGGDLAGILDSGSLCEMWSCEDALMAIKITEPYSLFWLILEFYDFEYFQILNFWGNLTSMQPHSHLVLLIFWFNPTKLISWPSLSWPGMASALGGWLWQFWYELAAHVPDNSCCCFSKTTRELVILNIYWNSLHRMGVWDTQY